MAAEVELVGRAAELARIAEALEAGQPGVLLAGPAGVGKTRLTVECLSLADARGHPTARVRANKAAATMPYGAFAPLLPRSRHPDESAAATLARAVDAVLALGADRPLFLVVDDAHDLDHASTALLHHLVVGGGLFTLVTARTGEAIPEPVAALWQHDLLTRIDLPPLSADDVGRLVADELGGPVDGGTARTLFGTSGGNPLFLRELVVGALETGVLRETSGMWHLVGELAPSTRLTEVVEARVGALDDEARRVLEVVSVGEPVASADLEGAASAATIDELGRRGLLQSQADATGTEVRMGHPLYGEVLRAKMPRLRYWEICRTLADAAAVRGEGDTLRVAVWRLESGGTARPDGLLQVALEAYGAGAPVLAQRLAAAAWEGGAGPDAAYLLGKTHDDLGRHEDADDVFRAAEQRPMTDRQRSNIAKAHAGILFRGLGRAEEAHAVAVAAEAEIADPALRRSVSAARASHFFYEGRLDDALELLEPLLEADNVTYADAALPASVTMALAGRTADAVTVATRGADARQALGDTVEMAGPEIYLVAQATALTEAGRLREAEDLARLGYEGATELGAVQGQAWLASLLGRVYLHQGRAASAARSGREAGVLWRELRHPAARWGLGAMAFATAMSGDTDGADRAYAEVDSEPPTPVRVFDPEIDRGRAAAAAHAGDRPKALALLEDVAARAESGGGWSFAAAAVHDLCRLGEVRTAGPRLTAMAERVDGDMMKARLAHVAALAVEDADGLDTAADAFDEVGALLLAAEAALAAAALHDAAGMQRKAATSKRRGWALLDACEGSRPLGVTVSDGPTTLTSREREIATLAARGMASKEIATTLVVSPRTVNNHLQRIYDKLGVRRRAELAEALDLPDDS